MPWPEHPAQSDCGKAVPAATILVVLLSAVVLLDLALPTAYTGMPLLVAVPSLAVLTPTCPRCSSLIGVATLLAALPLAVLHADDRPTVVAGSLLGIMFTTAMMWIACRRQERSDGTEADLRAVLEAMQRAVLRPVPARLGPLAAHARYLAAAKHAQVGGDLYDGVATPYGVRLIVGDAMGKGLAAVEKAADVLGAFRELAENEATLTGVAVRLDAFLAARSRDEEFVTALLVQVSADGRSVELVSCGHPPPLLLSGGQVTYVDVIPPAPPLGLLGMARDWASAAVLRLREGDRLLLYTDGVTEARDAAGTFFPLAAHVARVYAEDAEGLVATVERDLRAHVGGDLHDDAALLLLRAEPAPLGAPPTVSRSRADR